MLTSPLRLEAPVPVVMVTKPPVEFESELAPPATTMPPPMPEEVEPLSRDN